MRRRARFTTALAALAAAGLIGCQGGATGGYRRSAAKPEPALSSADEVGTGSGTIISKSPPPTVGFVERHPLFYKPREIYNTAGNNKVVKVAGAAIVGVPLGIAGELKQIVTGTPASQPAAY